MPAGIVCDSHSRFLVADTKLFNLGEEEDRDAEEVRIYFQKARALFRYVFDRYSSTGGKQSAAQNSPGSTPGLKLADVAKIFKDYGITPKILSVAEVSLF